MLFRSPPTTSARDLLTKSAAPAMRRRQSGDARMLASSRGSGKRNKRPGSGALGKLVSSGGSDTDAVEKMRAQLLKRFAPKTSLDRFKEREMVDDWDADYLPSKTGSRTLDRSEKMMRASSGTLPRRPHTVRHNRRKAPLRPETDSPDAMPRTRLASAHFKAGSKADWAEFGLGVAKLAAKTPVKPRSPLEQQTPPRHALLRSATPVGRRSSAAAAMADDTDTSEENWDDEFVSGV